MISEPRPAATVCVFRPASSGHEVLMVQRTKRAKFMGGAWVFPGGAIDEADRVAARDQGFDGDDELGGAVVAALRELAEETGIEAAGRGAPSSEHLVYFARWITPTAVPIRFDTYFFAVEVDETTTATPDLSEIDAVEWITPAAALERATGSGWVVPFPTQMTLRFLAGVPSVAALRRHVEASGGVEPVQPRIRIGAGGKPEVLLPDDPRFDTVGDLPPPSDDVLRRIARAGGPDDDIPELGP